MTFDDLKSFSCGEIILFTLGQLQLDKFELLHLAASGKIEIPDETLLKLYDLCQKTVADFSSICENNSLPIHEPVSVSTREKLSYEQVIEIISFIIAVITFIRSFFPSQESTANVTNMTINNYNISIEQQETLQYDYNEIMKLLQNPADTYCDQ